MMFSTFFLFSPLTSCSAISGKNNQNSGAAFSASTCPSKRSAPTTLVPPQPLYGAAHHSLRSQFESNPLSLFPSRIVRLFHAVATLWAAYHVLLHTVTRLGTVYAKGTLTSIQMGLLEIRHLSCCEYGNPSVFTRATLLTHYISSQSLKKGRSMPAACRVTMKGERCNRQVTYVP